MRLGYAIDDRYYGVEAPGHLQKFRENMSTVTQDQVNSAIKKYFSPENMVIVFVTENAEALKTALVNNTPSPIEYQTPKPESVLQEDKLISSFKLNIKPENVKIIKVEELFN
jgi:zinc protease